MKKKCVQLLMKKYLKFWDIQAHAHKERITSVLTVVIFILRRSEVLKKGRVTTTYQNSFVGTNVVLMWGESGVTRENPQVCPRTISCADLWVKPIPPWGEARVFITEPAYQSVDIPLVTSLQYFIHFFSFQQT